MANDPKYENVQFISICCDKLDGARDIIEKEDDPRWQSMSHYFMEQKDKEEAKKILGFKSVPFYVILDESGSIKQLGNQNAIDFEDMPGVVRQEPVQNYEEEKKEDFELDFQLSVSISNQQPKVVQEDRVFILDDLDF
jgi:hypothetical protein